MDAVELPYPVDVAAAPKLMGSVTVKELEACDSDRVSVVVSPSSIECCSSFLSEKGELDNIFDFFLLMHVFFKIKI